MSTAVEVKYLPFSFSFPKPLVELTSEQQEIARDMEAQILDNVDARAALCLGCMPPVPSRMMLRKIAKFPKKQRELLLAAFSVSSAV